MRLIVGNTNTILPGVELLPDLTPPAFLPTTTRNLQFREENPCHSEDSGVRWDPSKPRLVLPWELSIESKQWTDKSTVRAACLSSPQRDSSSWSLAEPGLSPATPVINTIQLNNKVSTAKISLFSQVFWSEHCRWSSSILMNPNTFVAWIFA